MDSKLTTGQVMEMAHKQRDTAHKNPSIHVRVSLVVNRDPDSSHQIKLQNEMWLNKKVSQSF